MNAAALPLPAPELLTAREIAGLLNITPRAVRLRLAGVAQHVRDGLQAWPFDRLPVDYQDELTFAKKKAGAWTFTEACKYTGPVWAPDKEFAKLPKATQAKAYKVREVMLAYDVVLEDGGSEHEARCAARSKWLELFQRGISAKQLKRWIDRVTERAGVGGIERLRIEGFADGKSTPHKNAQLVNRIPEELTAAFRRLAVGTDMTMTAAHAALDQDWKEGKPVSGLGVAEPGQPFPFTLAQLKAVAPRYSTRRIGNKGDAAAKRDALKSMTRTYADLRPCEMYAFDDTRVNVACYHDITGKIVEVKAYIAMELATRKIMAYVLREGAVRAADVDELVAMTLRHGGLAHARADYATTLQFERGTVACSPDRERLLRSLRPGQLLIKRTSMDGGKAHPGAYAEKASGHWMGKGAIESFMKTLGLLLRDLPGQRGSTYRETPAVVGDMSKPHAGGQVDEALKTIEAARIGIFAQENCAGDAPTASEAVAKMGVRPDLLSFRQLRQKFARAIERYNSLQGHRREGFDLVDAAPAGEAPKYVIESSNQRWTKLVWRQSQRGTAPELLSPADTSMLLTHRARPVTVRKDGVRVIVNQLPYLFYEPGSEVCALADKVTGGEKKFTALVNEDDLSEIFLLDGDGRFIESLKRDEKAGVNNPAQLAVKYAEKELHRNRARAELTSIRQGQVAKRIAQLDQDAEKMRGVVTTVEGVHVATGISAAMKGMARERNRARRSENPANDAAMDEYAASLKTTLAKMDEVES